MPPASTHNSVASEPTTSTLHDNASGMVVVVVVVVAVVVVVVVVGGNGVPPPPKNGSFASRLKASCADSLVEIRQSQSVFAEVCSRLNQEMSSN
ncbi:MAG: hypothetical protein GY713_04550 [Actinomycetia bacterium]|nr:hypothetical protein [Actinomycetes bacterium]